MFGLFDEQAVSILTALMDQIHKFSELAKETGLSKASLSRILKGLERAALTKKTVQGYMATERGNRIIHLILGLAEEDSARALATVGQRLRQMEADYLADGRIFHSNPKWERTADKPLIEVMAIRGFTAVESLLFQQRFLEEISHEEQTLRQAED